MQLCCLCLLAIHMVQKNIAISTPILWHEYTEVFQNNFTEKYWLVVMGYNYSSEGIISQKTLSVKYCAGGQCCVLIIKNISVIVLALSWQDLSCERTLTSSPVGPAGPTGPTSPWKKGQSWHDFFFLNMQPVFKIIKLSLYIYSLQKFFTTTCKQVKLHHNVSIK